MSVDGRFRVGLVGLQEGRSWGARAHVPALRALSDQFDIVGVANTSLASSTRAADALQIPRAFPGVAELVASPEIDVVAITVKVPHHFEIVKAAIGAGKHVYCEWPLGNGLQETEAMRDLAQRAGVRAVVGTQAQLAPEIVEMQRLVAQGQIGQVLSSTLVGSGYRWGAEVDAYNVYLLDNANGATLLTIPFGHTLAAVRSVLGEVDEVSARVMNRRTRATLVGTGDVLAMTAPDQLLAHAVMKGGVPLSIHYRGGTTKGTGLLWEINGTEGDLQLTGSMGHPQMIQLSLKASRDSAMTAVSVAPQAGMPVDPAVGNVARAYSLMASDLRTGTTLAPSFDDAVRLQRVIAAIEESAASGARSIAVRSDEPVAA